MKSGGAAQTLSGHNTYTGGTFVNGGTLQLAVEDALAATGPVTLGGGTLEIGAAHGTRGERHANQPRRFPAAPAAR